MENEDGVVNRLTRNTLRFTLSQKEYAEKAKKMAELDQAAMQAEKDFETIKEDHKGKIAAINRARYNLSRVVSDGFEDRNVECIEVLDYRDKSVKYTFNGEIMLERAMTTEELQADLNLKARKKITPLGHDRESGNDVAQTIREETNAKTKHTATDGPRA